MAVDSVADLLTRIRNGQRAGHTSVVIPLSKLNMRILDVLKSEGFVGDYSEEVGTKNHFPVLRVALRYFNNGRPLISKCQRVSKPGRRIYAKSSEISKTRCGLGVSLVSTSKGVMSDRDARAQGVGGEVLAFVA